MLQQRTALDALADLPKSRALEKARAKLEETRQLEQDALVAFREHCARLRTADRWVQNDPAATQSEAEAIRTAAAARLAHQECERVRQDHGAQLAKHLARHEADCRALLVSAIDEAHAVAVKLAEVVAAAERDGAHATYKLGKIHRVAADLQQVLLRVK